MSRITTLKLFRSAIFLVLFCTNGQVVSAQKSILDEIAVQRARIYEPIILNTASSYGIDARVLWVIAYLESRFDPTLVSRKGAQGLMQFMPDTAQMFGLTDPHDPTSAIEVAARYARFLASRFNNRMDLVLAAYNSGETTVEAYLTGRSIRAGKRLINPKGIVTGGIPHYKETLNYVRSGLRLLANFPPEAFSHAKQSISKESYVINGEAKRQSSLVRKSIRPHLEPVEGESRSFYNRRSIYFARVMEEE